MHAQLDPADIKRLELKSTHKSKVCVYALYPLGEVATLIQELDEHISAAECAEFPGMFG